MQHFPCADGNNNIIIIIIMIIIIVIIKLIIMIIMTIIIIMIIIIIIQFIYSWLEESIIDANEGQLYPIYMLELCSTPFKPYICGSYIQIPSNF